MDNIVPVDEQLPLRRQLLTKEHLDERGLARTAHADHKDELTLPDLDADMIEGNNTIVIYL